MAAAEVGDLEAEWGAVVLTSRDKGFAPYLGLHPLLSLKKEHRRREREKEVVTTEVRKPGPSGRAENLKKRDSEVQRGRNSVSWPWPLTGWAETLSLGSNKRFLWSLSPANFGTAKKARK